MEPKQLLELQGRFLLLNAYVDDLLDVSELDDRLRVYRNLQIEFRRIEKILKVRRYAK